MARFSCPRNQWEIRSYEDDWLSIMQVLAPVLRRYYPSGDHWLSGRLDDVAEDTARAYLAFVGPSLSGVAIETPKAEGQVKLSTLWVASESRNTGIGSGLLERCIQYWLSAGTPRSWITVGAASRRAVTGLVEAHGFRETAVELDRYGPCRHEWVLHWTPESHRAARTTTPLPPDLAAPRTSFGPNQLTRDAPLGTAPRPAIAARSSQ